jgi:NADH dehydrogenase (ubiquinone) 1 beta subcomplex subunit 9
MSVAAAGYLARRAAQKERVRILYRRALKDTLNWAVHRHLFYEDVTNFSSLNQISLLYFLTN